MARLPVYKIADIPREKNLHEGRMTRYSIRTKNAQIVFADITPQPITKLPNISAQRKLAWTPAAGCDDSGISASLSAPRG